jgi:hypothetical protein
MRVRTKFEVAFRMPVISSTRDAANQRRSTARLGSALPVVAVERAPREREPRLAVLVVGRQGDDDSLDAGAADRVGFDRRARVGNVGEVAAAALEMRQRLDVDALRSEDGGRRVDHPREAQVDVELLAHARGALDQVARERAPDVPEAADREVVASHRRPPRARVTSSRISTRGSCRRPTTA